MSVRTMAKAHGTDAQSIGSVGAVVKYPGLCPPPVGQRGLLQCPESEGRTFSSTSFILNGVASSATPLPSNTSGLLALPA
ncbi:hypothetical protein QYS36_10390 [Pseudomonas sp. G34]|uniref:hypothetical protein n=1 Tax=Pseudomonas sp. G34 TaxID=3059083 RepID=UPI002806DFE7|nr:hypothetical protein [Pseudomonas sp. G34]MDQ7985344.1 hypothetical protein [Pseudomonas sp. G34]